MKRRAQTALEFLVLTAFMLVIFSAFYYMIQLRTERMQEKAILREIDGAANILIQEVGMANQVYRGYSRTFELPPAVYGQKYNITSYVGNTTEVVFNTTDVEFIVFLPTNVTVNGQIWSGRNNISKNESGHIIITGWPS